MYLSFSIAIIFHEIQNITLLFSIKHQYTIFVCLNFEVHKNKYSYDWHIKSRKYFGAYKKVPSANACFELFKRDMLVAFVKIGTLFSESMKQNLFYFEKS